MLLHRKLQLMHSHVPSRATLIEGTGRKFADAIFQTATGHFGPTERAQHKMPVVAKVLDVPDKNYWASWEIFGRLGGFLTVIDNAVYRRFRTGFPQDSKAIFAQNGVSQQFVPPLTVCLQSRFPAFESKRFGAHVRRVWQPSRQSGSGGVPKTSQLRKNSGSFRS